MQTSENNAQSTDLTIYKDEMIQFIESEEKFPVDLDRVWEWLGYASKNNAKKKLIKCATEGIDYQSLFQLEKRFTNGGQNKEKIYLTKNCFKAFAMATATKRGDEVRLYYMQLEEKYEQLKLELMNRPQSIDNSIFEIGIDSLKEDISKIYGKINEMNGKINELISFGSDFKKRYTFSNTFNTTTVTVTSSKAILKENKSEPKIETVPKEKAKDYFTVREFAAANSLKISSTRSKHLSFVAKDYSEKMKFPIYKVKAKSSMYDSLNKYHKNAVAKAFKEEGLKIKSQFN